MPKREFVQLAQPFKEAKHLASGAYFSEKLDGFRAFWDGGVSRGQNKNSIPWANLDKDARFTEAQIATGLWTRYGNVIHAPDFWLDRLPNFMLDGELWMGRGTFQTLRSKASKLPAKRVDNDWESIQYCVFDMPNVDNVFTPGRINGTNFKKEMDTSMADWCRNQQSALMVPRTKVFQSVLAFLKKHLKECNTLKRHPHEQLPFGTESALNILYEQLDNVTSEGGEGLMLRRPQSIWMPYRTDNLAKLKKLDDSEATVVDFVTGRRTDKGSKLLGLMGALVVDWNGKRFELSGFTDEERVLVHDEGEASVHISTLRGDDLKDMLVEPRAFEWAQNHPSPESGPGQRVPDDISARHFKRGDSVTFRYRELTDDGVPKEARYWRRHEAL